MRYRFLLLIGLLAGSASMALANPVDPDISIDDGCCSVPISLGAPLVLNGSGGGVSDFFNPFNFFIDQLVFQATVAPNLSVEDFNCPTPTLFFTSCSVNYVSGTDTGTVTFRFFGTKTADSDGTPTAGDPNEAAEQEGIPELLAGCTGFETEGTCTTQGHFRISLNFLGEGQFLAGGSGGWNDPAIGLSGNIVTQQINDQVLPEPSTTGFLLTGLFLLLVSSLTKRRYSVRPGR